MRETIWTNTFITTNRIDAHQITTRCSSATLIYVFKGVTIGDSPNEYRRHIRVKMVTEMVAEMVAEMVTP